MKEELELCVERLKENDTNLYRPALETLRQKIRESTSSMTGVPKPLKFMRPFYNDMITIYEKIHDVHNKVKTFRLIERRNIDVFLLEFMR